MNLDKPVKLFVFDFVVLVVFVVVVVVVVVVVLDSRLAWRGLCPRSLFRNLSSCFCNSHCCSTAAKCSRCFRKTNFPRATT